MKAEFYGALCMKTVENKILCDHCGDECLNNLIVRDSKNFCCAGCNIIYEILSHNDLHDAYELPIKRRTSRATGEYDFLEEEEIVQKFLYFSNDEYRKVILHLPDIHCSACIVILEDLPKYLPGVSKSIVNFNKKELTILYRWNTVSLKQIAEFLHDLHYKPDFSFSNLSERKVKKQTSLGMKIAVAGFCFGNSMLITLPEYLDTGFHLEEKYKLLFSIVNLILIIPVVLYSGVDYFKSAYKGLRKKQVNLDVPIAIGILVLFVRTCYEIAFTTGTGYADSLTGLVFFLLIGRWYQEKTYQALSFDRDFKSFFPISVIKLVNGEEKTVPLSQIKPKDQLLIRNNELIPADAFLLEGTATINYSFVTGESLPERIEAGSAIYAGGRHLGPSIKIKTLKSVDNSYLTKLWQQKEDSRKSDPSMTLAINKISKYFTAVILSIAFLTALYWYYTDGDKLWNSVSSVLIVACPCALALASPFAYGHAMRMFGRHNIYLKEAAVVERLAKIKKIVWDKTGTLTNNFDVKLNFYGRELLSHEERLLKSAVHNSMHPLSKFIYQNLPDHQLIKLDHFEEIIGKGVIAKNSSKTLKLGSASHVGADWKGSHFETRVYVAVNDEICGYYSFAQEYRSGIFNLLQNLRSKYSLFLISGDNDHEQDKLSPYFDALLFNQDPNQKKQFVSELGGDEDVMMIGDGLNDSGALWEAGVGIAVTDDIHQFTPACDIICKSDQLESLDRYLKFSRRTLRIVYVAFGISFLYNVIGLSFAVSGHLTPLLSAILMPVSSVTVVLFVSLAVILSFRNSLLLQRESEPMIKVSATTAYSH